MRRSQLLEKVVARRDDLDEAGSSWGSWRATAARRPSMAGSRRIAVRPTLREHPTFWLALGRHEQAAGQARRPRPAASTSRRC